jgi:4-hydroxy-4-methyl-2-oxoglutarate aldolase
MNELTGLVDASRVHDVAHGVAPDVTRRLRSLADLSATVSDVLDVLGLEGAIGTSKLRPTSTSRPLVGNAVTVRKVPKRRMPNIDATLGRSDVGEIEGANQCAPGDVLVIEGQPEVSSMGGLMATMSKRQGALGAIVDGGVRDVEHARSIEFPVWSSHVTPVTGKWRSEVVEINGPVTICGCRVHPGDLVVADDTGVVFIPSDRALEVVEHVEQIARKEDRLREALAGPGTLAQLLRAYGAATAGR